METEEEVEEVEGAEGAEEEEGLEDAECDGSSGGISSTLPDVSAPALAYQSL